MKFSFPLKKVAKFHFPHQELVLWIVGLSLFVLLFTNFLISPSRRRVAYLKKQIGFVRNRFEGLSGNEGHSQEEMLVSLRKELAELEGNLGQKEKASELLTSFLKKANDLGINVISVRPEATVPYPSETNPLQFQGKTCQALSFQMDLRCSYRTLGAYLEALEKDIPFAFTVDGVQIEQKKSGAMVSDLRVVLFLTTYLFGNAP